MRNELETTAEHDGDAQPWPALRETTLAEIELRLSEIDEHASGNDVLLWMDRMTAFHNAVKQSRDMMYAIVVAWIQANGDLRLNDDVHFTVGYQRTTKCVDVRKTFHALLNATVGDLDEVAGLLSSDAWKHGACKHALPRSLFEELFVTEVRAKVVPGKREPLRLIRIDERYGRPR